MTITDRMESIKDLGPSWKTDVILSRNCYNADRAWSVEARDIWSHINSLRFYAKTPERALDGLEQYMHEITTKDIDDVPWCDHDGNVHGPQKYNGTPCDMGDVYLDA